MGDEATHDCSEIAVLKRRGENNIKLNFTTTIFV